MSSRVRELRSVSDDRSCAAREVHEQILSTIARIKFFIPHCVPPSHNSRRNSGYEFANLSHRTLPNNSSTCHARALTSSAEYLIGQFRTYYLDFEHDRDRDPH